MKNTSERVYMTPRTTFVVLLFLPPSWSCHERKTPSAFSARGSELLSVSREVGVYVHDEGKDRTYVSQLIIAETSSSSPLHVSALLFCKAEANAQAVIINFYSNKQSRLITSPFPRRSQRESEREEPHAGFVLHFALKKETGRGYNARLCV